MNDEPGALWRLRPGPIRTKLDDTSVIHVLDVDGSPARKERDDLDRRIGARPSQSNRRNLDDPRRLGRVDDDVQGLAVRSLVDARRNRVEVLEEAAAAEVDVDLLCHRGPSRKDRGKDERAGEHPRWTGNAEGTGVHRLNLRFVGDVGVDSHPTNAPRSEFLRGKRRAGRRWAGWAGNDD